MTEANIHSQARMVNINGQFLIEVQDNGLLKYFNEKGEEVQINQPESESAPSDLQSRIGLILSETEHDNVVEKIRQHLIKYIYLENDAEYTLMAVVVLLSYVVSLFNRIPYFWFRAEKGSGKTTLMSVLKPLVYNPFFVSNMTASTLFRIVHEKSPTLFLDEVEALATRSLSNNPFVQILNSGYQKDGSVTRTHGNKVSTFKTFSLKILAGINKIAETVEDRCIRVSLVKPTDASAITPYTGIITEDLIVLQNTIHSSIWKKTNILSAYLKNPQSLEIDKSITLREYDKWMPVLALAKVFSTESSDYFTQLQNYSKHLVSQKHQDEENHPEKICKAILIDYLTDFANETKIEDSNYFFFETGKIQKVITENDMVNTYRLKADVTSTLKKIGIETDRRRFGNGPVSLYKIPKSILL